MLEMERVRSHLANERNFLAWTRCSLTLAAQGIATWKLYDAKTSSKAWLNEFLYWTANSSKIGQRGEAGFAAFWSFDD